MIRPGQKVRSVYSSSPMIVVKVGLRWRGFAAVQCEKQGGSKVLCLAHNLYIDSNYALI